MTKPKHWKAWVLPPFPVMNRPKLLPIKPNAPLEIRPGELILALDDIRTPETGNHHPNRRLVLGLKKSCSLRRQLMYTIQRCCMRDGFIQQDEF